MIHLTNIWTANLVAHKKKDIHTQHNKFKNVFKQIVLLIVLPIIQNVNNQKQITMNALKMNNHAKPIKI